MSLSIDCSLYLLEPEVADFSQAVHPAIGWDLRRTVIGEFNYQLWVKANARNEVQWKKLLSITGEVSDLKPNRISSAVLLVKRHERIFALTFGYGHHLLVDYLVEPDFGLVLASTNLDLGLVREAGARSLGSIAIDYRVRSSKAVPVNSLVQSNFFQLTTFLDVVSPEPNRQVRHRGGRGYTLRNLQSLDEIPEILDSLFNQYKNGKVSATYDLLCRATPIYSNGQLGQECENRLIADIVEANIDHVELLLPDELAELGNQDRLILTNLAGNHEISTLTWPELLPILRIVPSLDVAHLKRARICYVNRDGDQMDISLWSCLAVHMQIPGAQAFLFQGRWTKWKDEYIDWLDRRIQRLMDDVGDCKLPAWRSDQDEQAYNVQVGGMPEWLCLDRATWNKSGRLGRFEICDLLGSDGRFVHVKKLDGSQSVYYVTSQAIVSLKSFLARTEIRDWVSAAQVKKFGEVSNSGVLEVVIAIGVEEDRELDRSLPLGAKLRLLDAIAEINSLGFAAKLVKISIVTDATTQLPDVVRDVLVEASTRLSATPMMGPG